MSRPPRRLPFAKPAATNAAAAAGRRHGGTAPAASRGTVSVAPGTGAVAPSSRDTASAAGVRPAPPASSWAPSSSSSLNVLSAVTGVRNSCDASATKRRSTSRSWRKSRTVDSSLPAMALNWRPNSPISPPPMDGARAARSPDPMRTADAVSPSMGAVNRRPNTNPRIAARMVAESAAMMNGAMIVSSASPGRSGLRAIST